VGLVVLWAPGSHAQLFGCDISTNAVPFGTYNVFASSPTDSTGSVSYSCFLALSLNVRIYLGTGGAGGFSPRRMSSGGHTLNYNLFRDAARSTVWEDGSGTTSYHQVSILALVASAGTVTIYGRVPALQDVNIGSYTDDVVASIVF
jgi:spore coat protein U-like protein